VDSAALNSILAAIEHSIEMNFQQYSSRPRSDRRERMDHSEIRELTSSSDYRSPFGINTCPSCGKIVVLG
jgi:hypothetical protein